MIGASGAEGFRPLDDLRIRPDPDASKGPIRLLCDTGLVRIGAFRASPLHPKFRDSGPTDEPVFVFPRTSVQLEYAGEPPFVTSPCIVTYYNRDQVYWRKAVDPAGDLCEWYSVRDDVLVELMGAHDPTVNDHPEHPFSFSMGPSSSAVYLAQRIIARHVGASEDIDRLAIEEVVLRILSSLVPAALSRRSVGQGVKPAHHDLAERVKSVLAVRFHEDLSLQGLSRLVGCSPYYLSRTFRDVTGSTIHQYRLQVRLRRSLERIAEGSDLAAVGLDVGFSTHSHFTATFRRAFGLTPSEFRRRASKRALEAVAPRRLSLAESLPTLSRRQAAFPAESAKTSP